MGDDVFHNLKAIGPPYFQIWYLQGYPILIIFALPGLHCLQVACGQKQHIEVTAVRIQISVDNILPDGGAQGLALQQAKQIRLLAGIDTGQQGF